MSGRKSSVPHISQANLFLFELILAAAFLSLSSVVCIQLYLKAHTLSRRSAARTHAVTEAQNAADLWLSGETLPEEIYYTAEWTALNLDSAGSDTDADTSNARRSEAAYSMVLSSDAEDEEDPLRRLQITVYTLSGGEHTSVLYSLEVERYVP